MDQKHVVRFETKQALAQLRRIKQSSDAERALAAKRVLEDKELLIQYVEMRLERKKEAERKEKFSATWKKLFKIFRPGEWRRS